MNRMYPLLLASLGLVLLLIAGCAEENDNAVRGSLGRAGIANPQRNYEGPTIQRDGNRVRRVPRQLSPLAERVAQDQYNIEKERRKQLARIDVSTLPDIEDSQSAVINLRTNHLPEGAITLNAERIELPRVCIQFEAPLQEGTEVLLASGDCPANGERLASPQLTLKASFVANDLQIDQGFEPIELLLGDKAVGLIEVSNFAPHKRQDSQSKNWYRTFGPGYNLVQFCDGEYYAACHPNE